MLAEPPPLAVHSSLHHRRLRTVTRMSATPAARSFIGSIPHAVLTDSYKACHPLMYPEAKKMVAARAPAAPVGAGAARR